MPKLSYYLKELKEAIIYNVMSNNKVNTAPLATGVFSGRLRINKNEKIISGSHIPKCILHGNG